MDLRVVRARSLGAGYQEFRKDSERFVLMRVQEFRRPLRIGSNGGYERGRHGDGGLAGQKREKCGGGEAKQIVRLALVHGLTAYDAVYLALAIAERLPLATLDKKLATAAQAENVPVLGPLGES